MAIHAEHHDEDGCRDTDTKLHPYLYKGMFALALWLLASIWSLAQTENTSFLFVVVSGLVLFAMLIPAALWTSHDFEMWQGKTTGIDAAVEILLPLAAVAFGMTAFMFVAYFSS